MNLVNDPTAQVEELKSDISPSDLFSFGQLEQSLVGSIDFTYRNVWNEIRTLHFEGQNAILLALKVLSNKIDQGVNQPRSVQVFCYSKHYNRTLRNLVSVLVNRCISIQLGDSRPTTHSRLRVAGKTGNSSLKKKGSVCNLLKAEKKVRTILKTFYQPSWKRKRLSQKHVGIHLKLICLPVKVFTILL